LTTEADRISEGKTVSSHKSSGHLSQVLWQDQDIQLQTEVRYEPSPVLTTIMVVGGAVLSRVEKTWLPVTSMIDDQQRVSEYHQRLTKALERLRDRGWIDLEDLPNVAPRIVSVALKFTAGTLASEALALLPGAHWAAVVDMQGNLEEAAPESSIVENWAKTVPSVKEFTDALSELFEAGIIEDISLKRTDGFVLLAQRENSMIISGVETKKMPEARQMIKRITGT
jgi:hypothetical protein